MPKLDKKTAAAVEENEGSGFEPIPDGRYELQLRDVTVAEGPQGPYWKWEFEIPDDAPDYQGRRFWVNTSLSERAQWKLKETFDAFEVPADTDTDELIGQRVIGYVSVGTINSGQRKGQKSNNVDNLYPLSEGLEEEDLGDALGGDDSDPPW